MKRNTKHNKALEWIINNPDKLCKNKLKFIAKEVKFYKPDGDLGGEIDVLAIDYGNNLYHVEYKSSIKHFKTAMRQLQTQRNFIKQYYSGKIHSVFMHDTNDRNIIKKGWEN